MKLNTDINVFPHSFIHSCILNFGISFYFIAFDLFIIRKKYWKNIMNESNSSHIKNTLNIIVKKISFLYKYLNNFFLFNYSENFQKFFFQTLKLFLLLHNNKITISMVFNGQLFLWLNCRLHQH
jgi:hypothetical protein